MKTIVRRKQIRMIFITGVALLCLSCGGGGDSDGGDSTYFPGFTPASVDTPMTVDEYSASTTASMVSFAHGVGNLAGPLNGYISQNRTNSARQVAARQVLWHDVLDQIRSHLATDHYQASGSGSDRQGCPYGGSYAITFAFDGEDPQTECDLLNLTGTMVMYDCWMDADSMMDGRIDFQFTGDACYPTAMAMALTDFTMGVYDSRLLSPYLDIEAYGLVWSGGTLYSGTTVLNGQAIGQDGGAEIAVAFYDYTESASTFLGDDGFYYLSLDISGGLTGPCVDGWAYVESDPYLPIILSDYGSCPVDGHLVIYGDYAMDVIYYGDGSVLVGETLYGSCEDLNPSCPLP